MLILFFVLVYGVPVLLGLLALLVGLGTRLASRAALAVLLPLVLLVGFSVEVYLDDGWTGYSRYLRTCTLLAALGLAAAAAREVAERRHYRR